MYSMSKIWKNRILHGTQEMSKCPDRYREDVLQLLLQDVENNVISEEKYTEITGFTYPNTK